VEPPVRVVTKTAKKARFSLPLQYMKVLIAFYPVFRPPTGDKSDNPISEISVRIGIDVCD
jgi:hypothetical protein